MIEREAVHKEIDLIQDIIKRMMQNSFQIKAWLIGILSILIAFQKDQIFLSAGGEKLTALWLNVLLLLPIISFWYLDAYFLSIERKYREIYKWVIKNRPKTDLYLYDLNTLNRTVGDSFENLNKKENSLKVVWKSHTLLFFYIIPVLFVGALLIYNLLK